MGGTQNLANDKDCIYSGGGGVGGQAAEGARASVAGLAFVLLTRANSPPHRHRVDHAHDQFQRLSRGTVGVEGVR